MSPKAGTSFDRVRPRTGPPVPAAQRPHAQDVDGKRALFSSAPPVPALGSLSVTCSGCRARSVLSPTQALRTLIPSVHLPLLRRERSFLRCPACGRWEWCRITLHI